MADPEQNINIDVDNLKKAKLHIAISVANCVMIVSGLIGAAKFIYNYGKQQEQQNMFFKRMEYHMKCDWDLQSQIDWVTQTQLLNIHNTNTPFLADPMEVHQRRAALRPNFTPDPSTVK